MEEFARLWLSVCSVVALATGFIVSRLQAKKEGPNTWTTVRTMGYTVLAVLFLGIPVYYDFIFGDNKEETAKQELTSAMIMIASSDEVFTLTGSKENYIILPVKQYAIDTLTLEGNSTRLNYTSTLYDTPLMITITRQFE